MGNDSQSLLENYQGTLLVAHPRLPLGNPFKETVIYVTQDNSNATIGLVLNVNSNTSVQKICNEKGILFLIKYFIKLRFHCIHVRNRRS